ncbi:MAG: PorT family protein [Hymenobacter sp.]|nr:MAG: PorT family protein [Hymenobacter sp.]
MKRFFLLLGSSLLLTGTAYAQLGARIGANLLNFSQESTYNDASTSATSRVGYQVGVYYQQPLTKRFSLVPEVQFSREQAHVDVESFTNPQNYLRGDYRLRLSYLNVPVLLRLALGPVYIEAGPQASLLVGGRGQGQTQALVGGDVISGRTIDQAATDRFRRLDAGACLGVGVQLPAGLGLSVRAYQGLVARDRDYAYQQTAIPSMGSEMYRQTLQASLTYQLLARQ